MAQVRPESGRRHTRERRWDALYFTPLTALLRNFQAAVVTRVTAVAGHSVMGFLLRVERAQRAWVSVPANCQGAIWKASPHTRRPSQTVATRTARSTHRGPARWARHGPPGSEPFAAQTVFAALISATPDLPVSPSTRTPAEGLGVQNQKGGFDGVLTCLPGCRTESTPFGHPTEL